ncbi:MAG: hypothetical protein R3C26_24480 [Calditrichia bacterium]
MTGGTVLRLGDLSLQLQQETVPRQTHAAVAGNILRTNNPTQAALFTNFRLIKRNFLRFYAVLTVAKCHFAIAVVKPPQSEPKFKIIKKPGSFSDRCV